MNDFAKQQLLRESSSRGQFVSFVGNSHIKDSILPWDNLLCILLLQPGNIDEIYLMTLDCGVGLSEKKINRNWVDNED